MPKTAVKHLKPSWNIMTNSLLTTLLHITSFNASTIKEVALIIQGYFNIVGKSVTIKPAEAKDTVQLNKRNEADAFITKWWLPKTTLHVGIRKVFDEMRKDYES